MFTVRNLGGVALFLFGTTYLWLTPSFATPGVPTDSTAWSVTNVLSLITLAGFCVATFGLFTRAGWWETAALTFAVVGLMSLVPYWMAAGRDGVEGPALNVVVHVLGSVGVLALLLIPALERWVNGHVMSGR